MKYYSPKKIPTKSLLCDQLMHYDCIIAGGGAAGFFSAIRLAELKPECSILIIEKTAKILSKVEISGGGRCNVTNACFDNNVLIENYPRGKKELLGCFHKFNTVNTVKWFESRGVKLKAEPDGRMFPETDSSQTIINCLLNEAKKLGIKIKTKQRVDNIEKAENGYQLLINNSETLSCTALMIATGGHPKLGHFDYLRNLKHKIEPPAPSLFTFNLPKHPICKMMGLSVSDATVSLPEHKEQLQGPVLITHWGLSGPAVLKLSAFAARKLSKCNYEFKVEINWLPKKTFEQISQSLKSQKSGNANLRKKPFNEIPQRLWDFFISQIGLKTELKWSETPNNKITQLAELLHKSKFDAKGKTTFKEEFVTCGGISRKEIDFRTMESKLNKNIFFAGEVLDIDGITGGFNFQAAWTCGYIAGESIADVV